MVCDCGWEHRWTAAKELAGTRSAVNSAMEEEDAKGLCYRKNRPWHHDPFQGCGAFQKRDCGGYDSKAIAVKFLVDTSTVSHRFESA
jgi:hypothetical protein